MPRSCLLTLPSGRHLLFLLCLLWSARAGAQAAVLVYPGLTSTATSPTPVQIATALREAAARRGPVRKGAIDAAAEAEVGQQQREATSALRRASDLLDQGRHLLGQVELERAAEVLAQAEEAVRAALALPEAPERLAEVLRWRAVAAIELRRPAEASALVQRALVLRPSGLLSEAEVRPDVAAHFRRAAAALPGKVALSIEVPPLSQVMVDGMATVTTGASARIEVIPGQHVVALLGPTRHAALVAVPPAGLAYVPAPPPSPLVRLRRRPDAEGLSLLCRLLQLDSVIVAQPGLRGGDEVLVAQRVHCKGGAQTGELLSPTRGGPIGPVCERLVAALWQAGLAPAQAPLLRHPALAETRRKSGATPLWRRPWIWLGATLISTAVVLSVSLWPRPEPMTAVTVDPAAFSLTSTPQVTRAGPPAASRLVW